MAQEDSRADEEKTAKRARWDVEERKVTRKFKRLKEVLENNCAKRSQLKQSEVIVKRQLADVQADVEALECECLEAEIPMRDAGEEWYMIHNRRKYLGLLEDKILKQRESMKKQRDDFKNECQDLQKSEEMDEALASLEKNIQEARIKKQKLELQMKKKEDDLKILKDKAAKQKDIHRILLNMLKKDIHTDNDSMTAKTSAKPTPSSTSEQANPGLKRSQSLLIDLEVGQANRNKKIAEENPLIRELDGEIKTTKTQLEVLKWSKTVFVTKAMQVEEKEQELENLQDEIKNLELKLADDTEAERLRKRVKKGEEALNSIRRTAERGTEIAIHDDCINCGEVFERSESSDRSPRILPCGDSHCLGCLKELYKNKTKNKKINFYCHGCNTDITLPKFNALIKNQALIGYPE